MSDSEEELTALEELWLWITDKRTPEEITEQLPTIVKTASSQDLLRISTALHTTNPPGQTRATHRARAIADIFRLLGAAKQTPSYHTAVLRQAFDDCAHTLYDETFDSFPSAWGSEGDARRAHYKTVSNIITTCADECGVFGSSVPGESKYEEGGQRKEEERKEPTTNVADSPCADVQK